MTSDDLVGTDLELGARNCQLASKPACGQQFEERPLVGEDRHLVAVDHVEVPEIRVEERGRSGAGHDRPRADRLDVLHRPRELAVDLRLAQPALLVVGHVVHHRIPDRTGVLEPVQVDRPVRAECVEVGRAAVVLVDEARSAVGHHHRRVAAGAIGDRHLGVDRDRQPGRDLHLLAVDGRHELGEAEPAQRAALLTGGVAGEQDRDVTSQVLAQPRLVVVIGVEVRDVEEVGVLDALQQIVAQLIVAGEDEPRAEERRDEPRVAQDRSPVGFDEHSSVSDRRGAHGSEGIGHSGDAPAGRRQEGRSRGGSGDGRIGVLLPGS